VTPEEIELLSELTIVIPTHNRPYHLERAIEYWQHTPVTVFVIDGSEKAWFLTGTLSTSNKIFYYHMPQNDGESNMSNYCRRLEFASHLPKTKFSALCADDDFFTLSGMKLALNKLSIDKNIDAVVGICAEYMLDGEQISWHLRYTNWKEGKYSRSSDTKKRVLDKSGSFYLHYAIMRTEKWKLILRTTYRYPFQHHFAHEHLHRAISLAHCRVAVERHIVWCKESFKPNLSNTPYHLAIREADWYRAKVNRHEVDLIIREMTNGIKSAVSKERFNAQIISKKYLRRAASFSDTYTFRRVKKTVLKKINLLQKFLPNNVRKIALSILPKKIQLFSNAELAIPHSHLTKNNYFELEHFLLSLADTDILFDTVDFEILNKLLSMPRENFRLKLLI